jgi:hypothetical protein
LLEPELVIPVCLASVPLNARPDSDVGAHVKIFLQIMTTVSSVYIL